MSTLAIVFIVVLGLILLFMALMILLGVVSFSISFSPKGITKKMCQKDVDKNAQKYMIDKSWWDNKKIIDYEIKSNDGYRLKAHFIDAKTDKIAILVHGFGGNWKELNVYAKLFLDVGYSTLMVECRAHGESEGRMVGMGWLDRLDLLGWIDLALKIKKNPRIVLFGLSMGAATVCMASGEKLPENVIGIISDCGFDNVYDEFVHVCGRHSKFISRCMNSCFNFYMKRVHGYDMKKADAISQIKKSNLPMLVIHGKNDSFVPPVMAENIAKAAGDRAELYLVDGAEHICSYATNPRTYKRKVKAFLARIEG